MYRVSKTETGKRIRKLMLRCGVTVRELQEEMNLESPQSVYKWINGKAVPSIENLLILGKMLNMPVESIVVMEDTDPEQMKEWKKKHPPIAVASYYYFGDQIRKANAERLFVIVEDMRQERMRTALCSDQSSRSS